MINISTNVVSKINQIQVMVPEYDKVCYGDKAIADIYSHLPIWSINTESPRTHTKMIIYLFTLIYGSSSLGEINKVYMSSSPHIIQRPQILSPQCNAIWWN